MDPLGVQALIPTTTTPDPTQNLPLDPELRISGGQNSYHSRKPLHQHSAYPFQGKLLQARQGVPLLWSLTEILMLSGKKALSEGCAALHAGCYCPP